MTHTKPLLRAILWALTALCIALPAAAFDTRAREAWIYDMTTDTVLLDKNAEVPMPPASMSKLMTINMLFEALKDGRVTLDTQFGVSSKAKSMTEQGGSTMYLQETDRPTVDELIHGMIINSGNDACVVVAEGLAGSEDAFAQLMTKRAKALGLEQSTFANASGWPDPGTKDEHAGSGNAGQTVDRSLPGILPRLFARPNSTTRTGHQRTPTTATRSSSSGSVPTGSRPDIPKRPASASSARSSRANAALSSC
jgi:D-alanyl-D-alanine carboxypeptidase (penicillin-binding protein 5/6)